MAARHRGVILGIAIDPGRGAANGSHSRAAATAPHGPEHVPFLKQNLVPSSGGYQTLFSTYTTSYGRR